MFMTPVKTQPFRVMVNISIRVITIYMAPNIRHVLHGYRCGRWGRRGVPTDPTDMVANPNPNHAMSV